MQRIITVEEAIWLEYDEINAFGAFMPDSRFGLARSANVILIMAGIISCCFMAIEELINEGCAEALMLR